VVFKPPPRGYRMDPRTSRNQRAARLWRLLGALELKDGSPGFLSRRRHFKGSTLSLAYAQVWIRVYLVICALLSTSQSHPRPCEISCVAVGTTFLTTGVLSSSPPPLSTLLPLTGSPSTVSTLIDFGTKERRGNLCIRSSRNVEWTGPSTSTGAF